MAGIIENKKRANASLTADQIKKIEYLFWNTKNNSDKEIAEKIGVDYQKVMHHLRKHSKKHSKKNKERINSNINVGYVNLGPQMVDIDIPFIDDGYEKKMLGKDYYKIRKPINPELDE